MSVTVCVRVCVCVCRKPVCMPIRKIRWVFVCVSSVCVCRDHICEYVRAVPSVDGSAGDPVRVLCCECDSVCVSVCVCVCLGEPHSVCF